MNTIKRKHSNSIVSSDSSNDYSPRTSSPIPEEKYIKCFQLIVFLPKTKNVLINITNFINITELSKMTTVKIHSITDDKWIFMVPENDNTMQLCSDIAYDKFSKGILSSLTFDFKFPCNSYYQEYSDMYNNANYIS